MTDNSPRYRRSSGFVWPSHVVGIKARALHLRLQFDMLFQLVHEIAASQYPFIDKMNQ
jgi:hypothetical protein